MSAQPEPRTQADETSETSDLEKYREHRMENDSPDLPFRLHGRRTGRDWGLLLLILALGLAIPLAYIAISLISAVISQD
ncbi:MAG: hypothetical protein AB1540_01195 [Bdellovibrionota bacterium]